LSDLYEAVQKSSLCKQYSEMPDAGQRPGIPDITDLVHAAKEALESDLGLKADVKHATERLGDVANSLSLAFVVEGTLVFLGDLEKECLATAVKKVAAKCSHYEVLVAPHHGRCWRDELRRLWAERTLVSNGQDGFLHYQPELCSTSREVLLTHVVGDIMSYDPKPVLCPLVRKEWPGIRMYPEQDERCYSALMGDLSQAPLFVNDCPEFAKCKLSKAVIGCRVRAL